MGCPLLQLSDAENWLSTGPASTPDSKSAVFQFDLLGILDLPVLLLLVDTVARDHVARVQHLALIVFKLSLTGQNSRLLGKTETHNGRKPLFERFSSLAWTSNRANQTVSEEKVDGP